MGWETVAFVEKEPFCHKVLNKNFPGVPIHDDIFTFSGKPFRGAVDIITGGFPCQPFSAAGKRKGRADERHLFPEMLRVIREVEPRWVVAENVRGLLSIESGAVFAEVVTSLEGEGYEVITFCVPASAVEAPHRRDRLWIVAHSNSRRLPRRNRAGSRSVAGCGGKREAASNVRTTPAGTDPVFNIVATNTNGRERSRLGLGLEKEHAEPGDADRDATHSINKRRVGRGKQREIRERQSDPGCGNDRAFGESAIDHRESVADSEHEGCNDRGRLEVGRSNNGNGRAATPGSNERIGRVRSDVGPDGSDVADSGNQRLQGNEQPRTSGQGTRASRPITERFANESWLEAATRFCGIHDGLSDWLDRDNGVNYASITNTATRQDLFRLREHLQQEAVQETLRSYYAIHEPENLFAVLRQLEKRSDDGRLSLASVPASEAELRALWNDSRSGRSPQRREYQEQHSREHPDLMSFLSHEIALATESAVQRFKVGTNTTNRVDRLKSLGNAIVPQVALEIFRAIEAAEIEMPERAGKDRPGLT